MTDEEFFRKLRDNLGETKFDSFTALKRAVSKAAWQNSPEFRIPVQFDFGQYVDWALEQGWIRLQPDEYYQITGPQSAVGARLNA